MIHIRPMSYIKRAVIPSALLLLVVIICILTVVHPDAKLKSAIFDAYSKLEGYEEDYLISRYLDSPINNESYIVVKSGEDSYTEYPLESDGSVSEEAYEKGTTSQYMMYDWLSSEGLYLASTEDGKVVWLRMPDNLTDYSKGRTTMYFNLIKDSMYNIKDSGKGDLTIGDEVVEVDTYTFNIPAEKVRDICGVNSLAVYKAIKESAKGTKDKSVETLADKYISELETSLTYSEGVCTVAIYKGVLRYLSVSAGGLGGRMVLSQTVMDLDSEVHAKPDFSSSGSYYDSLKSFADYCEENGGYEEALKTLDTIENTTSVSQ